MVECRGCISVPTSSSDPTRSKVTLKKLLAAGKSAARSDSAGRLARAKLRHAAFTLLPDQLVGGALMKRHLQSEIALRKIEVRIANWPAKFDGVRLGHISDLHVGDLMPTSRAIEAVHMLRSESPDLIACTGDVVDLDVAGCEPVFEALGALRAPLGRYFVLGNHDLLDNARRVLRLAQSSGLKTLRGEMLTARGGLRIAGIDWSRTLEGNAHEIRSIVQDGSIPHLLLAHNPKAFREAAKHNVPLTLAGHTHGGQFTLNRKGREKPRLATAKALRAGHYHDGASHLFVTTGAGGWFPLRVNCPAEVVVITVRRG